ncbi:hypothetical protein [Methylocaldum sp.]|uniref:hypothetical protein n=1 Tax=Methylocaldum sp. TaxID=1969727 RepID=UPI00321FD310
MRAKPTLTQVEGAVYAAIKAGNEIDLQSLVVRRLELAAIVDAMPRVLKQLTDELTPLAQAVGFAANRVIDLQEEKAHCELVEKVTALSAAGDSDKTMREKLNLSPRELDLALGRA